MKAAIIWIIVILAIIGGIYWMTHRSPAVPLDNNQAGLTTDNMASSTNNMASTTSTSNTVVVTYTDKGFTPNKVNIALGDTVKFVNNSSGKMWVASNVHPQHAAYDGTTLQEHCGKGPSTSFDECAAVSKGGSYSFTFDKAGSWDYHNHSHYQDVGTVVVLQQAGS